MKIKTILFSLITGLSFEGIALAQITPTDCANGNVYQMTSSSTTTPSTLWVYNPVLGTRTSLGTLPGFVNGIGQNPVDNYLWGCVSDNTIVKIGTNGNWEVHTVPNLTTGGGAFNTGTISSDGYYYLTTTSSSIYYTIDLDPSRPTYLQLVDPTAGYVPDNTAPYGTAMSPTRDISDWAYNPVDGMLYAMINTDAVDTYHLMVLNPKTGVSTLSASPITGGDIEGSDYGGAYFDSEGNFYVIRNASGHFYRINTTTFAATRISGFSVSPTEYNDAAACGTAPQIRTDLGDAPDSYGTLFNSTGAVHIFSNNLMIGSVVDHEDDGVPSSGANGDDTDQAPDDEDGVTTIPAITNNATSYSITVAVTNTSGAPAVLAGWVDFNGDGIFQSSERATAPVADGQTSAVLTWSGLSGIAAGNYYMRFRIATDGNELLSATGPASNGEVEDYPISIAPSLSGTVFNDSNGLNDAQVNGTPISTVTGSQLYVSLYDGGTLVSTISVAADGTYEFVNVTFGTTYTVVLGTDYAANASSPFAGSGDNGWVAVGEDCCDNAGGDGTPNGGMAITIGSFNTDANFGIEQQPDSDPKSTQVYQPTVNQVITLNGGTNPPVLSGSDREDMPLGGVLTGKTVTITAVPTNSELYYNDVLVTSGLTITDFDPSKLQIKLTAATLGDTTTKFEYAYVDAAGVVDPTPAIYELTWQDPMPVTLVSFEVSRAESAVLLHWATTSETNSSHFEIERSVDARQWETVGRMEAAENANKRITYDFTDHQPPYGSIYYRLKMVDLDETFTYSQIRSLSMGRAMLMLYPNPVVGKMRINDANSARISKVVIYSKTGTVVYSKEGPVSHEIDLSGLQTGAYLVTLVYQDGSQTTQRIIKN
jgi:hypothetical protein